MTDKKYPKSIDTLIPDIYHLLTKPEGHTPSEENLEHFSKSVIEGIKKQLSARDGGGRLRMSNIGKKDRQLYYDMKYPEVSAFPDNMILRFLIGDIVEAVLLFLAREAGHTVEDEQLEVEIDGVKGHQDARIDGVVTDAKSTSSRNFAKFEKGTLTQSDPYGYIGQISGYTQAQDRGTGAFWACDVNTGHMALLKVHPMEMINAEDRVKYLKDVIEKDTPPERCYEPVPDGKSGNIKINTGCTYCAHKFECFKDANNGKGLRAFQYANEIRYLTKVVKEPKVDEI